MHSTSASSLTHSLDPLLVDTSIACCCCYCYCCSLILTPAGERTSAPAAPLCEALAECATACQRWGCVTLARPVHSRTGAPTLLFLFFTVPHLLLPSCRCGGPPVMSYGAERTV